MKQYIGARYVPKIATPYAWDINATYEPLTIVGYLGNSYTSKKTVPAGTQISNEEYWALTSMTSGDVEQLRQEVMDLSGEVAGVDADIQKLNGQVSTINGEVQTLKTEVAQLENTVTDLVSRKYWLVIGDSYMGRGTTPLATLIKQYAEIDPNVTVNVIYAGGGGFTRTDSSAFNAQLNSWYSGNTDNAKRVTDILVCGGANDQLSVSTIVSSIRTFCSRARTLCPNAKVHIADMSLSYDPQYKNQIYNVFKFYKQGAGECGAGFVENLAYTMHWRPYLESDLVHPNNTGVLMLAQSIASYIGGDDSAAMQVYSQVNNSITGLRVETFQTLNNGTVTTQVTFNLANITTGTYEVPISNPIPVPGNSLQLRAQASSGGASINAIYDPVGEKITVTVAGSNPPNGEFTGPSAAYMTLLM